MTTLPAPYDILAIGAHPDDIEVGCGGVLIDQAARGRRCGLVIMTQGEMGTGGNAEIREKEVAEAAMIMGADLLAHFNWGDCRLEDSFDKRLALAQIIRRARPKMILTPYPHVGNGRRQSHPDHVACGVITVNASNLATLKKAEIPEPPHQVQRVFHYFLPPGVAPSFVVDITAHFERWIASLSAHQSQFLNPEKSRDYIENLTSMARSYGSQARCKYGQGYLSVEPLLIGDIMSLVEQPEG